MPTSPYDGTYLQATDATVGTYSRLAYPNPFFDLSRNYYPKTVKSLFKYCRIFFYQNEFIHNVISKLASYPITDFIYDGLNDDSVKENYQELADHHLKLKSLLIEIGLDYYVYGNCIISANMKFKKFLICPVCGNSVPVEKVSYRWVNYGFTGDCAQCQNKAVQFTVQEKYLKNPKYFKFIRWAPENITIDFDELTGESRYFYNMNEKTRKGIQSGKKEVVERVPELFITAIKENKKIELDTRNLYHFKRPTLAEEDQGWGKPILLPVMKMLWYMQTLRRGNEAIVSDHLVPMRALFPAAQGNLDPFSQMNLGQWRSNVEEQVLRWRRDPNHVGVFPIPIGYQSLGGDAKMLMVTPELQFLEESIINSLGVPIEFIKGGSTWTSSSVSLRIVENGFLNYREQITDFLNYFVVPKIKYFLGYPPVTMRLKKFKMSDDVQAKELVLQLSQLNKISDSYVLEEFGIDPVEDRKYRKSDSEFGLELSMDQMKAQSEAQGKGQVILARYQTLAQLAAQEEAARANEKKFSAELVAELKITDQDPSDVLQKTSLTIQNMDPKTQQAYLAKIQQEAPRSFGFIMARLQNMGVIPNPEEQRALQQQEQEAKLQQKTTEVESQASEKEHAIKMKEIKLKMIQDEQRHQHKVEESKLPVKKDVKK
jgi:hypothetical protein